MTIEIVRDPLTLAELRRLAGELFGDMVKAVIDVERGIMAIGGELHADEEAVLSHGCQGGITGGGNGVTVQRDGRIARWTVAQPGAPRQETTVTENPEGATRLFALLEELNFQAIDFDHEGGNWSCDLSLRTGEKVHSVGWGRSGFPGPPPEVQQIVSEMQRLAGPLE